MLRRISIIGVSGNGKTTLAKQIEAKLGVPRVELDALAHKSGWREADAEEMRTAVVDFLTTHDGWVIDGSYVKKLGDLVFAQSDVVVWLDLPLTVVMPRLIRRALRDIVTQRDMFNGNRQSLRQAFFMRDSLVSYALKEHVRRRKETPVYFAARPHLRLMRLRSPREVRAFVDSLSA